MVTWASIGRPETDGDPLIGDGEIDRICRGQYRYRQRIIGLNRA